MKAYLYLCRLNSFDDIRVSDRIPLETSFQSSNMYLPNVWLMKMCGTEFIVTFSPQPKISDENEKNLNQLLVIF